MKQYLLALAVVCSSSAFAAPDNYSPAFQVCAKRAATGEQSRKCYDAEVTFQKKRINTAYNRLLRHYAGDIRSTGELNKLQKDWIAYRDGLFIFLDSGTPARSGVAEDSYLRLLTQQASHLETVADVLGD